MVTSNKDINEFTAYCDSVYNTKNAQRGDAWKEVGLDGASIEIHAKWARLKQLILIERGPKDEEDVTDVFDTLVDLCNYSRMAAALLCTGRWRVDDQSVKEHIEMVKASCLSI